MIIKTIVTKLRVARRCVEMSLYATIWEIKYELIKAFGVEHVLQADVTISVVQTMYDWRGRDGLSRYLCEDYIKYKSVEFAETKMFKFQLIPIIIKCSSILSCN